MVKGLTWTIDRDRFNKGRKDFRSGEDYLRKWQNSPSAFYSLTIKLFLKLPGNFLGVQWLGLLILTAEGLGLTLGQRTKIPQAARAAKRKKKNQLLEKTKLHWPGYHPLKGWILIILCKFILLWNRGWQTASVQGHTPKALWHIF